MNITCTFNDFKSICKDQSLNLMGGKVLYVKGAGVTYTTLLNSSRLGMVFALSNTPTEANFLVDFPNAIKVDSIS